MINEPAYNIAQSMRDGAKTYTVNLQFVTQLSPTQETAINNKSALKELTYREAVKLSGTDKHQVYYEIDITGIQNATAHNGVLLVREAEKAEVKYKIAQGEGKLSSQVFINS